MMGASDESIGISWIGPSIPRQSKVNVRIDTLLALTNENNLFTREYVSSDVESIS